MVEVVHDFLTYVQAGLNVAREDTKRTHGASEVAEGSETPPPPCRSFVDR